ncbi:MAG: nitroreductase family protein [Firmicutes bacterium]|nr:nitroreductase family protein [Bacillota bacterium]
MENPVLEAIYNRSSIRGYRATPVSKEQLEALVNAALASPTARNLQKLYFSFVTDQEMINELELATYDYFVEMKDENTLKLLDSRNKKIIYDAPLFVAISNEKENNFGRIDAGIAVQSMAIAAKSLGLDSVILGFPGMAFASKRGDYFREKLRFPEGYDYIIGIAIGTAAVAKAPHEKDRSKVVYI